MASRSTSADPTVAAEQGTREQDPMSVVDGEPLGSLDVAFLCLEAGGAPMHIGGLVTFQPNGPVDPRDVAALLAERAARIPRLGQRIRHEVFPPGAASWVADPDYAPEHHVHVHRLPSPGGAAELESLVSQEMAAPLDLRAPLWQAHVISGNADGSVAVLVKLHHALADGTGAMQFGLGLLDQGDQTELPPIVTADSSPTMAALVGRAWDTLTRPDRLIDRTRAAVTALPAVAGQVRDTASIAAAVVRHARWGPRASVLPCGAGRSRQLAIATLPLGDARLMRDRHGGTVNDVLLGVLAGALRTWLSTRDTVPRRDAVVRALIPVSLRGHQYLPANGSNHLSGYLCDLPVGIADPVLRLHSVRAAMDANKAAGPLRGPGAIPVLADRLPPLLHRLATPLAGRGASLLFDTVITSVPVPAMPLSLAGAALTGIFPIVPLAAGHGLNIALLTYQGSIHIGLYADPQAVPDLGALAEAIPRALRTLADVGSASGVPAPRRPHRPVRAELIEPAPPSEPLGPTTM